MLKKVFLVVLVLMNSILLVQAQKDTVISANRMKPAFQKLLLELSTTYFTVLKENEVDLDSSLIHVSHNFLLSRLPIVAEGISEQDALPNAGWIDQRKPADAEKELKLASGRKHAALSIVLGAYFAFEPGSNKLSEIKSLNYLTTGLNEVDQWHDIKLKLAGQRLLAKLYLKSQRFGDADKLFAQVAKGYLLAGDPSAAATTYAWWGLYMPVTPNSTTPRIAHIETAIQLFKSLGDEEGQINSLMNECYLYMLEYNLTKSLSLAKAALTLTENVRFPYTHYVTGALMSVTMFQGKFGEPLTYGIESVHSAEVTKDNLMLPYFYGVVADLYGSEGGREDVMIYWEKKSINSFLSQHEPCYMGLNDMVMALMNRGQNTEALTYINKVTRQVPPVTALDKFNYYQTLGEYAKYNKQYNLASKYFNEAALQEKELELHGLNVRKPTVLISFANLYLAEKNYKQASLYYHLYLLQPAIVKGGFFSSKTMAYENLAFIDSIAGNDKAQLRDYRQFMNITVQNYAVSKIKLAEELQVRYATSAKESQIKLLNQKAKLEQENLRQANITKNITIAVIILLLIIAGLLYRQGAIRKKNNEIILRKNALMQKLLEEKEWLVKEIHHRVKNNLHTVICLLESQAMYLENDALKAVENSRHRIYAMSLIHQKLYQSDDIKVVNMKTYLADFVIYLEESFGAPENIRIKLDADEIKLGAGQAIPIGLIVNEAITNAFKYAFPSQKNGEIEVMLKKEADTIYLSVADNGIGFKQIEKEVNSLGLELIKGLALDLRGELILDTVNGTSIQISFQVEPVGISTDEENNLTLKV